MTDKIFYSFKPKHFSEILHIISLPRLISEFEHEERQANSADKMNWLDVSVLGKYLDLRFIRWVQAVVQHNEQAADVGWLEPGLTFQCHTRV